jgi:hypothetical protein
MNKEGCVRINLDKVDDKLHWIVVSLGDMYPVFTWEDIEREVKERGWDKHYGIKPIDILNRVDWFCRIILMKLEQI